MLALLHLQAQPGSKIDRRSAGVLDSSGFPWHCHDLVLLLGVLERVRIHSHRVVDCIISTDFADKALAFHDEALGAEPCHQRDR